MPSIWPDKTAVESILKDSTPIAQLPPSTWISAASASMGSGSGAGAAGEVGHVASRTVLGASTGVAKQAAAGRPTKREALGPKANQRCQASNAQRRVGASEEAQDCAGEGWKRGWRFCQGSRFTSCPMPDASAQDLSVEGAPAAALLDCNLSRAPLKHLVRTSFNQIGRAHV